MDEMWWWWWTAETRSLVWVLFLGQFVSLTVALGNLCSSMIANLGVDAPLSQSLFTYIPLAFVCGGIMLYRGQKLLLPWYWYLLISFADVQGNYLFNKALQYSSITSVTLLDCWTIAWVICLTRIVIGTRYSLWQMFGAAICVTGLVLVLLSDAGVGGGGDFSSLLVVPGDTLVIGATVCYAMSNVGQEFCVKMKDIVEFLAMLGLCGSIVSICEILIFEIESLKSVVWSTELILSAFGYSSTCILIYISVPLVLKPSGSTFLNLSLLTSDMWAVVCRIFIYHQKVDWLYYLSFATVAAGLVIYTKSGKDPDPVPTNSHHAQYLIVKDEAANESGHISEWQPTTNVPDLYTIRTRP